jgi:hypothetical protein
MPLTFGGKLPDGFSLAIRLHIHELQANAYPPIEWNWSFNAVPGGAGVNLRIPAKHIDGTSGWGQGKEFINTVPNDIEAARNRLSRWFAEVHRQFMKETGNEGIGDLHTRP